MSNVEQIKLEGTSFNSAYPLSFSNELDFVNAALEAEFYGKFDDKKRKKLLREVYKIAKKSVKKEPVENG